VRDIVKHWPLHEPRKEGSIGKKPSETAGRDEHNVDEHALPHWGDAWRAISRQSMSSLGSRFWHQGLMGS
jgi:hypothetical protein